MSTSHTYKNAWSHTVIQAAREENRDRERKHERTKQQCYQKDKCLIWETPLCAFHLSTMFYIYRTKWLHGYSLVSLPWSYRSVFSVSTLVHHTINVLRPFAEMKTRVNTYEKPCKTLAMQTKDFVGSVLRCCFP